MLKFYKQTMKGYMEQEGTYSRPIESVRLLINQIVGYSIGEHKSMGNSWVILIADRFDEKVSVSVNIKGIENVKEETKEKHQEMQSVFSLNTNECLNTIFDLNFEDKDWNISYVLIFNYILIVKLIVIIII